MSASAEAPLTHLARPAFGDAEGLLVLFHGRGADERDLYPLLDVLDPERRLAGVTPRGPLHLPPGGAHWYAVREIGYPDPATFLTTFDRASSWLDALAADTGIPPERTVLGGFSQGAVMTYALGLGTDRPRPAALVALSGFIPTVPDFHLDLERPPRVAIGHGALDGVISVEWGRKARQVLEEAGSQVLYHESPQLGHAIDPRFLEALRGWIPHAIGTSGG